MAAERGISKAEAERRLDRQAGAPGLDEQARKTFGARFGGVWVDVKDGDSVKVGVVGMSKETTDAATAAIAASETDADVVEVKHNLTDLEEAAQWLGSRLAKVDASEQLPLAVGIQTDRNVVALELPRDRSISPAQREIVNEALATTCSY